MAKKRMPRPIERLLQRDEKSERRAAKKRYIKSMGRKKKK